MDWIKTTSKLTQLQQELNFRLFFEMTANETDTMLFLLPEQILWIDSITVTENE